MRPSECPVAHVFGEHRLHFPPREAFQLQRALCLATTGRSEANFLSTSVRRPRRLRSLELRNKVMRKDIQEALENAIAGFEQRQQAEQERLRQRERFETDWAQIRTTVVLPALEEVAAVLRKAGWLCEVRAGDKDPGVHFTIYRGVKAGVSGGEKPFMTYQPEKQKNTVLINVATKASAAPVGSFTLDKITEDFVQTEATKFFARVAFGNRLAPVNVRFGQ